MRVMFLGGPLDHAIREVDDVDGIPPEYAWVGRQPHGDPDEEDGSPRMFPRADYHRVLLRAGGLSWWVFTTLSYQPSINDAIDSMPQRLKESLP